MSLANTHPIFQARIARVAVVAGVQSETVYKLWREYSRRCEWADQSALLPEFVEWYRGPLGGDTVALRAAMAEGDAP